jgi:HMG (high mobility group) box
MNTFVVVHITENTELIGVFFKEVDAKKAAAKYIEDNELEYKKRIKKEDQERILYSDESNECKITLLECEANPPYQKKPKKDPNAPKKGKSAYMIFASEKREEIKKENPDATFGELGKLLGQAWKDITEKEKEKYNKKAEKDKKRYDEEMKNYTE